MGRPPKGWAKIFMRDRQTIIPRGAVLHYTPPQHMWLLVCGMVQSVRKEPNNFFRLGKRLWAFKEGFVWLHRRLFSEDRVSTTPSLCFYWIYGSFPSRGWEKVDVFLSWRKHILFLFLLHRIFTKFICSCYQTPHLHRVPCHWPIHCIFFLFELLVVDEALPADGVVPLRLLLGPAPLLRLQGLVAVVYELLRKKN